MLRTRLPLALDAGMFTAPVLVSGVSGDADLSGLPQPVTVVQTRQPDHDRLRSRGFDVRLEPGGPAASVLVCLPRERALARDHIASAAAIAPMVVVDGQKTDGIDAILRECRSRAGISEVIAKAHGKIFAVTGGRFDDWLAGPAKMREGFLTAPGVFSADGVDPASALLADALPEIGGTVIDLGAGWGYLAARILVQSAVTECHLVEVEHAALACARVNVTDPRARFHWADATAFRAPVPVDHVVCNPPFHRGRRGDPGLGRAFIAAAAAALGPRGTLWLVANRHLPYETALTEAFAEVEERPGTPAFKIVRAARPRRPRREVRP